MRCRLVEWPGGERTQAQARLSPGGHEGITGILAYAQHVRGKRRDRRECRPDIEDPTHQDGRDTPTANIPDAMEGRGRLLQGLKACIQRSRGVVKLSV
jgi:hypothetical protein